MLPSCYTPLYLLNKFWIKISRQRDTLWELQHNRIQHTQLQHNRMLKVSGNSCDDHDLTSIVWKKALLQLFLYFSVQIETENYKLIYESQFKHFTKRGKFFYFSLLEWRVVKNRTCNFWLRLYFLRYWPILHFCFLWNWYQK